MSTIVNRLPAENGQPWRRPFAAEKFFILMIPHHSSSFEDPAIRQQATAFAIAKVFDVNICQQAPL